MFSSAEGHIDVRPANRLMIGFVELTHDQLLARKMGWTAPETCDGTNLRICVDGDGAFRIDGICARRGAARPAIECRRAKDLHRQARPCPGVRFVRQRGLCSADARCGEAMHGRLAMQRGHLHARRAPARLQATVRERQDGRPMRIDQFRFWLWLADQQGQSFCDVRGLSADRQRRHPDRQPPLNRQILARQRRCDIRHPLLEPARYVE
jgi:hypothetical protein